MSKKFDKLDEVFNVSGEVVSSELEETVDNKSKNKSIKSVESDAIKDYEYVRGNMYSIIEKGQEALNNALDLAQETESARAYEVVGQLIKNVSDSAEKLIDLQKKLKDLEEDNSKKIPTSITNALFVGSTAELSKLLKDKMNTENPK
jgi:hypothetical protein